MGALALPGPAADDCRRPAVRSGRRSRGPACSASSTRVTRSPRRTARATRRPRSPPACSAATAPMSSSCSAPRRTRSPTRFTGRRCRATWPASPAGQVTKAVTYWTSGQQDLVSANRHSTYAVLQLAGVSDQARVDTYKAIKGDFPGRAGPPGDGITAQVGGGTATEVAINDEVSANIARAESISLPRAAHPAGRHLRRCGRRPGPAGDRRPGDPRLVHRAPAAHHGHHGLRLLSEHHHDLGPRPGHRLRAVHRDQVPRGTAPPGQRRGGRGTDRGHRGADGPRLWRHRRPGPE